MDKRCLYVFVLSNPFDAVPSVKKDIHPACMKLLHNSKCFASRKPTLN